MMSRNDAKTIRTAGRFFLLLAAFVLLLGGNSPAESGETADFDFPDFEEIEILPPDATLNARDKEWHTPGEGSPVRCSHENCYWNTPMGYTDEDAVWKMLMTPVTVLDISQRKQYKVRQYPDRDCTEYTGGRLKCTVCQKDPDM